MSILKLNGVQIGQSLTAANNFTWYQPATPDGTVRFGNGNAGSVTDILTCYSNGNIYSSNTITASAFVGSFSGSGASLTSIPNSSLTNSSVTINGSSVSLGGTVTIAAGATITDDTTTNASRYVMLGQSTSGSYTVANTSSTKLTYNPSTGALSATSFVGAAAAGTLSGSTLASGVTASSLTSVGTITSGTWSGSFGAVSGANLTGLTAGNLSGTIPSGVLGNSTHYVGTTAIALNRASASQTLTGVSIDGTATSSTSASYTTNINSAGIQSNLNSYVSAGTFGFDTGTTNRPEAYGQGIGIASTGTAWNQSNNWYTQLAFGTSGSSAYFRTAVNAGSFGSWYTLIHSGNYTSYAMPAGASATNSVDVRAPIFYDSNNTGYYIDPNSTGTSAHLAGALYVGMGVNNSNIYMGDTDEGTRRIHCNSNRIGFLNSSDGWGSFCDDAGWWQSDQSVRSPIFYDSNDTGYYTDPASTSSTNHIIASRIKLTRNYGHSIFGVYDSTRYQGVWSMGESWYLPDDGTTTGNLYGLSWSHPNAGGVAANLNDHGLLVLVNGGFRASVTGSIRCVSDMRTPVYYDSNDTYYYNDLNSSRRFAGRTYIHEWIEFVNYTGLYSPNNGAHFRPNEGSYGGWRCDGSRNGWQGIEFVTHTTLMMNDDAYGFHKQGTGWRFYVTGGSGHFPGSVTAYWSDRRLKENLRPIGKEATDILSQLTTYRFNWNKKVKEFNLPIEVGKEEIGLIAQDVQKVLPDAVVVNKSANTLSEDGTTNEKDYLTINWDKITPLLVQSLNDTIKELNELKQKLKDNGII